MQGVCRGVLRRPRRVGVSSRRTGWSGGSICRRRNREHGQWRGRESPVRTERGTNPFFRTGWTGILYNLGVLALVFPQSFGTTGLDTLGHAAFCVSCTCIIIEHKLQS
jgi:hypothetical protein